MKKIFYVAMSLVFLCIAASQLFLYKKINRCKKMHTLMGSVLELSAEHTTALKNITLRVASLEAELAVLKQKKKSAENVSTKKQKTPDGRNYNSNLDLRLFMLEQNFEREQNAREWERLQNEDAERRKRIMDDIGAIRKGL